MLDDPSIIAKGLESSAVVAVIGLAMFLIKWLTGDYLSALKAQTESNSKLAQAVAQLQQDIQQIDDKVSACSTRYKLETGHPPERGKR